MFSSFYAQALFLFTLSFILAGLEVEAEGKYGWASKMPTWYRTSGIAGKLYGMIMGGKPLTGYHSFMFVLPLAIFHAGFFMGAPWSLAAETLAFAKYFATAVLWDFLWFVINPAYGMSNFTKESVWWHAKSYWVFGLFPADYAVGWAISLGCAFAASKLGGPSVLEHAFMMCGLLVCTIITIALSPLYHAWYKNMRKTDDRDTVEGLRS